MLTVRPARPEDAAEVAGVHVRSWQVGYRGLLPDEYLDGLRGEDRMHHYTFGATGPAHPATVVAVEDGRIRGFATVGPCRDGDEPAVGEVSALYVDPGRWRTGAGRVLMSAARAELERRGFSQAVLWVLVGNVELRVSTAPMVGGPTGVSGWRRFGVSP
jgi:GNAT superfamily N-acetyltransferase